MNDEISFKDFDLMVQEAFDLKATVQKKKEELSKINEDYEKQLAQVQKFLEATGNDTYKNNRGVVFKVRKFSVSMPKDPDNKKKFYDYLKEKQIFEDTVTVNYQTLNALYNQEREVAKEKGELLEIPGLGEPVLNEYITVK